MTDSELRMKILFVLNSFYTIGNGLAASARLRSEFIGVVGIGKFLKVVGMKGAQMSFGLPYSRRPVSLHGYYAYKPGKIDYVSSSKWGDNYTGSTDTILYIDELEIR